MSEQGKTTSKTNATRGIKAMAAGLVLAIAGTVAVSAWAQPEHGGGHGGMGGPGMGMFMGRGHGIDRMLDAVNATDAQRAQIKQITQQAAADLKAQHEAGRTLHQRSLEIFTAPTVDAAAAESLRQQMLSQHDAASRRMLQAMLDVSRVLTPEQRAKLGDLMKQREQRMHEHMQQRMNPAQPKQ